MGAPTFRTPGPNCHGTGDVVVTLGTHLTGDSLWILGACDTDTINPPAGYSKRKTAFLTGIALSLFSRNTYAASAAEANPTFIDPGNHFMAISFCGDADLDLDFIAGCSTQGSTTTMRTPSGQTKRDDITAMLAFATANSAAPGTGFGSAYTHALISGLAEYFDDMCNDGNGSGICAATGLVAAPTELDQGVATCTAGNTVGMLICFKQKPLVAYNGIAKLDSGGFAANGTIVRLVDTTQPDVVFTATVAGGAGAYSALVRYDDHTYVPFADNGTKRGCGAEAVP